VIATLSPASKDTEHSLNTLRHACVMSAQQCLDDSDKKETRFITGGVVKTVNLGEIDMSKFTSRRGEETPSLTSNGNEWKPNRADDVLSEKEKDRARRKREKLSLSKLKERCPQAHRLLGKARAMAGRDRRQYLRLRQPAQGDPTVESEPEEKLEEKSELNDPVVSKANDFKATQLSKSFLHDDTTPHALKLRQFRTLMKMNGLDPDMAENYLHAPGSPRQSELVTERNDDNYANSIPVNTEGTESEIQYQSDFGIDSSPEAAKAPPSRHDMARFRREKIQQERDSKLNTRVRNKASDPFIAFNTIASGLDTDILEQIAKLEKSLKKSDISDASKAGLQRRLATQQSILKRRQRQREQAAKKNSIATSHVNMALTAAAVAGETEHASPERVSLVGHTTANLSAAGQLPSPHKAVGVRRRSKFSYDASTTSSPPSMPVGGLVDDSMTRHQSYNHNLPQPSYNGPRTGPRHHPKDLHSPPVKPPSPSSSSFGLGMISGGKPRRPKWVSNVETCAQDTLDPYLQHPPSNDIVTDSPVCADRSPSHTFTNMSLPPSALKILEQTVAETGVEVNTHNKVNIHSGKVIVSPPSCGGVAAMRERERRSRGAASAPWANDFTADQDVY